MHETLDINIKSYIDDIQIVNNEIVLKGWIFHILKPISSLRIIGSQEIIISNLYSRDDVCKFYSRKELQVVGWECKYPIVETIWLEALINNRWIRVLKLWSNVNTSISNLDKSFVVVDNFYQDPDSIREFALRCDFVLHPSAHKGRRTDNVYLFPGLKESFERILGKKIKDWTRYGTNGCFQYCIGGDQLVYHCDTQTYAGIIYLTPDAPPESGTSLYRSKITKKMKTSPEDDSIVFKNGFLDPSMFDLVDVVGNVYNRLILFDAKFIHAASSYFGNNKENGRLFQLFFFDFE